MNTEVLVRIAEALESIDDGLRICFIGLYVLFALFFTGWTLLRK